MSPELKKTLKDVSGFLHDREAETLYNLAKNCTGRGVIVEIGSWKGRSTICLALGSKQNSKTKVYAIDPHVGSSEHQADLGKVWTFDEFQNNITRAGVDDVIEPLVMTSAEAAKNFNQPIELLFIDGEHTAEAVKNDFKLWAPKVMEGGIIALHDTIEWSGPREFARRQIYRNKNYSRANFTHTITYATKTPGTSLDKIRDRLYEHTKDVYEVYWFLRKQVVKMVKK